MAFFVFPKPIGQSPKHTALGRYQQEQAAAITQLLRFVGLILCL
jgi:hypothetical protein